MPADNPRLDISKYVHRMDCAHNVSLMRLAAEGRIDESPDPCDCKDKDGKFRR